MERELWQVPGTLISPGAVRCHVPPHEVGTVNLCVATEDGVPLCQSQPFTYRLPSDAPQVADAMCEQLATLLFCSY
jgi:hypothetical protein